MRDLRIWTIAIVTACGGSSGGQAVDAPNGSPADSSIDTPGGNNPTTITVTLTDHPTNASAYAFLVAYQDGATPWQLAPAPNGDVYTFPVSSPVWRFAWTCVPPNAGTKRVELAYFAVAERTSLSQTIPRECSDRYPADVALSGSVSQMPAGAGTYAAMLAARRTDVTKTGTAGIFPPAASTFKVPPGTYDLIIAHANVATTSASISDAAIVRGVTTPATTPPSVDYSTSKPLPSYPVTLGSVTGQVTVSTTLYTASGTTTDLVVADSGASAFTTESLASTQAAAGDIYDQMISVSNNGATSVVENWTTAVAAQTYAAPAPLGGAASSVAAPTPYPLIATTWNAYPSSTGYVWSARQGGAAATPTLRWRAIVGPVYLGASPHFEMPDLSPLAGWSSAQWAFQTGSVVNGNTAALTSSAGATDFPPAVPAVAAVQRSVVASDWAVTP